MGLDISFFKGKKVFITGNTGFKGSWLTAFLLEIGAEIFGYSLEDNTKPCMYDILDIKNNIAQTFGDIRNYDLLRKSLIESRPDIIIHLAAQPLVRDSYVNPRYTYETNILGTVNVLDIAKVLESVKSLLIITSDKCYSNLETNYSYKEDDPLGGHDPYSSSKACADLISTSYYKSFFANNGVGLAIARSGNIIGGGDWSKDRVVPDAIRAYSSDNILEIRNPNAIRPWQYILDPLYGYLLLITHLSKDQKTFSGPWNFGPSTLSNDSVRYVCDRMTKLWGNNSKWIINNPNETIHEANLLMLNSDKASERIEWRPKYNTDEAIDRTINWYQKYYRDLDMIKLTYNEINNYMSAK